MSLYKELGVLDYINRSFRDMADQDYIAARIHYRYRLGHQFFWSALQALEKYLKAILLYNRRSTRELKHNIVKAFERVQSISDIPFDFPKGMEDFIRHLNDEGPNRYFEYPAVATGRELLQLDRSVWYVRRYCQYLRYHLPGKNREIDMFPVEIARIRRRTEARAQEVHIFGGYLEGVLARGPDELRGHLIWKNFHYGRRRKKVVGWYRLRSWSAYPATSLHPAVYRELKDLVDFSRPVRAYLEQQLQAEASRGP